MRILTAILAPALTVAALLAGGSAQAAQHEVKLLNRGSDGMMVFEPALVKAAPGDTVTFVVSDKGHNVQSIAGMLPAGVQPFASDINQGYTLTVTEAGVYGVDCKPHYPMGMVALIVVGDGKANLTEAKATKLPPKAKERMDKLFQNAGL
ncbi:pseudoazurin [Oleisolibacter albus]|uniref:pseudoazurin n=1 Tax=Oleisolibacter albus TaxID=2171757 RepID=UPI000DF13CBA|nr:pseudoazurin [Oleisolibacter albus]